MSLQRADPPSRGVLQSVCVCVIVIIKYNNSPVHVQQVRRRDQSKEERKKGRKIDRRKKEKKVIIHKGQKLRSDDNSKDRKIIVLINKAVSTAWVKNRHVRREDGCTP